MTGVANNGKRLQAATKAWRESLILLSGRNRLLNYRPTRSSTLEFVRASADEVVALINANRGIPVVGLVPQTPAEQAPSDELDLEQNALDIIEDFNYKDYPDHLFVNKTQREVDRGLKSLASTASREYLDRGLSVLYIAMGALHWQESNGDSRVSPLVFQPVELRSDGPRQPQRVYASEEDLVVNPALDIRLREHGVVLPDQASVERLMAEGGVAAVEDAVRSLELAEGWEVKPLCVLSAFMFAKEAMFRDLEANEDRVLTSSVVQALAGAGEGEGDGASLTFVPEDPDRVDEVAPPEESSLILDADSSQRVAVLAAAAGRSFVLDGPPGTGKSQTIANIVATLVAEGKRVLFVSEKAVALDVVRDRLSSRGLSPLLFELHSHKATRAEVAKSLGRALSEKPGIVPSGPAVGRTRVRELRHELSLYAAAMNEKRAPIQWSVHDALGRLATLPEVASLPRADLDLARLTPDVWEQTGDLARAIGGVWEHLLQGEHHLWRGIANLVDLEFDVNTVRQELRDLVEAMNTVAPDRADLNLAAPSSWRQLAEVSETWREGRENWRDETWIVSVPESALGRATMLSSHASTALASADDAADSIGAGWRQLASQTAVEVPERELREWFPLHATQPVNELRKRLAEVDAWLPVASEAAEGAASVAKELGLRAPRYMGDIGETLRAAQAIIAEPRLTPEWLVTPALEELAAALAELDDAQRGESEAADASGEYFSPSISGLDVAPIKVRWDESSRFRQALFGPAGSDRKALSSHTSLKPRAAIAHIDAAANWQEARDRLGQAGENVRPRLGFVPTTESEWARANEVLARARRVLSGVGEPDGARLRASQASEYGWQAVSRNVGRLEDQVAAVTDASESLGGTFADSSNEIDKLRTEAAAAAQEAHRVLAWATPFSRGGDRSLTECLRAHRAAQDADKAWTDVEREFGEVASVLPGLGETVTAEWKCDLDERLAWTTELRRKIAGVDPARAFRGLETMAWSDSLRQAGPRWDAARDKLVGHFAQDVYSVELDDVDDAASLFDEMLRNVDSAQTLSDARAFEARLSSLGLGEVIDALKRSKAPASEVEPLLQASAVSAWVADVEAGDNRLRPRLPIGRAEIADQFRELDKSLVAQTSADVLARAVTRRPTSPSRQTSLILGEAEKKKRHIPVRDLIARARDVIQAIHPCFMMSPLAVSQYLPPDIEFDVVIFDEASQVPPGDAINCLYRARAVIAAGDQKQLPPTSFFAAAQASDDDFDADEDLANDYESLLDLMKSSGEFTSISLNWHYRSRHEHLIAYSNNSFYEDRLVTFPGALDEVPDAGVKFFKIDGVYRRSQGQDNPKEAQFVAQRVIHHLDNRRGKSVGVVAMSAAQRDAISNALLMARNGRPDLDDQFVESRLDGIFVKSLEEVQGDERDVIIMSIGYGPDDTGTVYRNFGPINKQGGERRLNVAITRARELTEVVASMGAGDIGDIPSAGGRHLRKYLDYAERGPAALAIELGDEGLGTDSPFEDAVISSIRSWGYEVQPQVGVSGFRIDIGVKHPRQPGVFMLGVECDGAMYHSAKAARDRDRLRHDILEGLGWDLHHIWGTDWYRNRTREEQKLRSLLESLESMEFTGRVRASKSAADAPVVTGEPQEFDVNATPDWMREYVAYSPPRLRALDWTDSTNARHLVGFIQGIVETEGPVHIDLIKARLREHSGMERVNKHGLRTIMRAIELSDVSMGGDFVRRPRSRVTSVRRAGERSLAQVDDSEFKLAVKKMLESQAGPTREDLTVSLSRAFGWRRTPQDASTRVDATLNQLISAGDVIEEEGVLRLT